MAVSTGFKQTEVGIIPGDWDAISILSLSDNKSGAIKIGPFGSQLKKELLVSSGYKIYGQENVYAQDMELGDRYLTKEHFQKLNSCELVPGDFIVSMMGTIGQCMIVPDGIQQGIIDSHLIRIRLNLKTVLPKYLSDYYSSKLVLNQILRLQVGGIMAGLSSSVIKQIYIGMPNSIKEQTAIAEALSDADALIAALEALIAKKRQIKQGAMQELLTGKRRLPGFEKKAGYQQTEIGVIPDDWEVKQLGQIANIRSGGTPSTANGQNWDGGILWCTPTDITSLKGYKYLCNTNRTISQQGLDTSSAEIIPSNSIIMTSRATIGECAINQVPVTTNQGFKNFIPFNQINFEFFFYILQTQKQGFIRLCGGSTFLEIGKSQLVQYSIPFPPTLAEQEAIAEILGNMDAEIETLETKLSKARQVKQGMMQELLTGKVRLV